MFLPLCIVLAGLTGQGRERMLRWTLIAVMVAGAVLCLRLTAEHIAPPAGKALALGARPIVALRAFAEYAGLFLAPVRLHMERDVLPFGRGDLATTLRMAREREFQTLLGAVLLGGFAVWMRWAWRRDAAVFAGLLCFGIAYLPVSGLFSLNASVAEHWLYVPGAFLLMAMLLSVAWLPVTPEVGIAVVGLWAVGLGVRTILRNADWHDDWTFVQQTIRDGGESARMLINRGGMEEGDGKTEAAIADFQKALELEPDQPFGMIGLGSAYLRDRQYAEARAEFEKALDYPITGATALDDLAVLEYVETRKDRLDLLEKAAEIAPEDWDIQKRYITHLGELGQLVKQLEALRAITTREPWRADAWEMLGDAWAHVRQFDSAERAYRKAIALDVHDDATRGKLDRMQKGG
jgi:Flp pilus assembly protein TadD